MDRLSDNDVWLRREDRGLALAGECGGGVWRGPDLGLQKAQKRGGVVGRVEVERQDDVVWIVDRTCEAPAHNSGRPPSRGEAVECRPPCGEVSDGVLNVQSCHALTICPRIRRAYPSFLGSFVP